MSDSITKTQNIVIFTNSYGRGRSLVERSLQASLEQQPMANKIVFIDQNDSKLTLSPEIEQHPLFIHLHYPVKAVSKARNLYEMPLDTDWVIFCDDDGFLEPDYMKKFTKLIATRPDLEIIAGSIIRDDNKKYYSPRHQIGGSLENFSNTKLLMGSNFAVRPETFRRLRGFDEDFGAGAFWGSSEETDFAWKAYFAKAKMAYYPDLIVYHIKPYAGPFFASCRKAFRYGVGKGAMVAKWIIQERKFLPFYELAEMLLLPLMQAVSNLFRLKQKYLIIHICAFVGRIVGLLQYPCISPEQRPLL